MKANDARTDEELAAALRDGDDGALRALHRRHAPLVFTAASRALGEVAAEDVVQEVFVAAWRDRAKFDAARGTVRSWLMQIARSPLIKTLRSRRRNGRAPAVE